MSFLHTNDTLIMKFGGAALASPEHFDKIAKLIEQKIGLSKQLVIVVSAMQKNTDQLIQLAHSIHPCPPQREYDMLISVGERISMALLAMALAKRNLDAISLTGSQSGIITCPQHTQARIIDVKPHRILQGLQEKKIVIVAGFQGVSSKGEITTLGRGGSDTTAVALGIALHAQLVEFYKDVPGVCSNDPKTFPNSTVFDTLSFEEALRIVSEGAKILHKRALEMAEHHSMPLHILPFAQNYPGTKIGMNLSRPEKKVYENIS